MQDDIRIHTSLQNVTRNAHDTVPRHFGPPGAVDYRTLPGRSTRSDDPNLIFDGMRTREPANICPDVKVLKGTSYSFKNRQIISRWIRDVCAAFKLRTSTFNLGVQLCDVFMMKNLQSVQVSKCQCVALAAIWLAAKFEELDHMVPPAQHLSDVCDRAYPTNEIIEMEERMLATMRWKLPHTTTTNFLYFFLHVLTHNAGFDSAPIGQRLLQQQQNSSSSNNNNNNSQSNNNNNNSAPLRRVLLLKPGTQGQSTTVGVPSAGPTKPEIPDEWIDVTGIVNSARDLAQKSPQNFETTSSSLIQKLCVAMGHSPSTFIRDSTTGQTHVAHTTVLQLQGKSLVLAYKVRPSSLLGLPKSATATTEGEDFSDLVVAPSEEIRLFLRVDKQDGTFSECRGVSLLRGPNNELLRTADALTREAFLHVEFLPCQAHEMGLAILTVSLVSTSSDTAEISLLLGMLLRRLKIEAKGNSNFVMATQLLCEKALAGGVIGHPSSHDNQQQQGPAPEAVQKMFLDRNKQVLQSLVALAGGGSSSSSSKPAKNTNNNSNNQAGVDSIDL